MTVYLQSAHGRWLLFANVIMKKFTLTTRLERAPTWQFTLFTASAAFLLYTCVYGFRKTFSVATFDTYVFLGISYKVWLVTAQVAGYALSKFIGIKVVSEMKASGRAKSIFWLVIVAGSAWGLFALVPAPYNLLCVFLNGLPLGMIWGLIFSYLEGRQTTDLLGAGLSISFIFSAGFAKTVGAWLMAWGVSETWMPFTASILFLIPLLVALWLLDQVPPPTAKDEQLRTKRQPMQARERFQFMAAFAMGLVVLIAAYLLLTMLRDFRDNFAAELWLALGKVDAQAVFTTTEIPIALVVLVVMGSLILVRNNAKALFINHVIILIGFALMGIGTVLFQHQLLSPYAWMVVTGLGLYLGYVPFNCIFFERLMAAFKYVGTVGFVMYLADSVGYLGSVGVLFYKEFAYRDLSWLLFYQEATLGVSVAGIVLIGVSMVYFDRKLKAVADLSTKPAANALA